MLAQEMHPFTCQLRILPATQVIPLSCLPFPQPAGEVPASLAKQPQLGTLRLDGNQLGGSLEAFAAALPEANCTLFLLDVSRNQLGGPLPAELERLGVFSPDQQFVMSTQAGQVRVLDWFSRPAAGRPTRHTQ